VRPVSALSTALAIAFFAGCSTSGVPSAESPDQTESNIPAWFRNVPQERNRSSVVQARPLAHPIFRARPTAGIYVAEYSGSYVYGYRNPNDRNTKPVCRVAALGVNGFTVDSKGNLVVPSLPGTFGSGVVSVYRGPRLCGKLIGSVTDPYGAAADAATANAESGKIVVANLITDSSDLAGNVAICTLSKGCTRKLTSPTITGQGGGVALAKNGDCWMASENNSSFGAATLTYFKGCKEPGKAATGWKNAYYGGLVIDRQGNLISVDGLTPAIWVYRGCDPACGLVAGPFPLEGGSFYGSLNANGNELAIGDFQYAQADVYKYSPKKLTYLYSFNKDLFPGDHVEAASFSPSL
jgi:hypothetical protein